MYSIFTEAALICCCNKCAELILRANLFFSTSEQTNEHAKKMQQQANFYPHTLTVATLNIHNFSYGKPSQLAKILQPYKPDIVCLQEVWKMEMKNVQQFAKHLGLQYCEYADAIPNSFGNAFVSRYPMASVETTRACINATEQRAMTGVVLEWIGGGDSDENVFLPWYVCATKNAKQAAPFVFFGLHLDHAWEPIRLGQVEHMFANNSLYQSHCNEQNAAFHVIAGDFNAITHNDYTPEYLHAKIAQVRAKGNWEVPTFDLMNKLVHQLAYTDTWRSMNSNTKDAQCETNHYHTRIDYILAKNMVQHGVQLVKSDIVQTFGYSDHNAVVTVFAKKMQ